MRRQERLAAFVVGVLFAIGLGISGMTQPQKVIGFLDILGRWDPSLVFVMAGAVLVHMVTYRWIRKRNTPLFAMQWHVPNQREITPALMIGASIFGFGWGLGGYCPGPAVTSLASGEVRPWVFTASLLVGMLVFRQVDKKWPMRK